MTPAPSTRCRHLQASELRRSPEPPTEQALSPAVQVSSSYGSGVVVAVSVGVLVGVLVAVSVGVFVGVLVAVSVGVFVGVGVGLGITQEPLTQTSPALQQPCAPQGARGA